ncbi:MAG TPA: acyl-[acyl-carrier-protein] thioesterase [Clostridiales bacterium]|nr:acyl-[acyl-carrier-protein] thioesterase [Clostridiales bacterium]
MYTFDSRVRFSEINHHKGFLDLTSIINYYQDCSTFQSEDLNIGFDYLQIKNRVWLLNSWQVQLKKPVHLGDYITIGTWPYDFNGCYGYRNFIMKDKDGTVLNVANSIWVYVDTLTGRPTRVPEDSGGYKTERPFLMEYADRKIKLPDNMTNHPVFPVVKSNIDSYNHVNNGQYIKMAEEFLPEDFNVSVFRVEYKKQAVLSDSILPRTARNENLYTVALCDTKEQPYAIIEFTEN